jgi:urease accessory protein
LWRAAAVGLVVLLAATPAAAHTGTGLPGGFVSGFMHPLSGFDHMLAMVSVGLWGAFLGRPLVFALPVIFPTVMAFGGLLAMLGVHLPPVEIGIAISVLVLGGVIAAAYVAPVWLACVIVAIFAIFHGYAHGKELPSAADPIGYSVGFVLATGLLHVVGIGIGTIHDRKGGMLVVRGLGGAIALCGCFFLYKAIA